MARPRGRGMMRGRGGGPLGRGGMAMGRGGLTGQELLDERKKNRRLLKKKGSSLEESFPAYLQVRG